MSIAPLSAAPATPAPVSINAITARMNELSTRMGAPAGAASFATALASATAPAAPTGPAAGQLSAAAYPGQGLTGVPTALASTGAAVAALRPASLTGPSPVASGDGAGKGSAAVAEAKKYLGTMYQWGGSNPTTGFDCSGLVQWAYAQQGVTLPRVTYDQVNAGTAVPVRKDTLRPGDLLFTNYSSRGPEHVLMYVGDGKAIEAPRRGVEVRIRDIDLSTVKEARRVTPAPATPAPATPATAASPAAAAVRGADWVSRLPQSAAPYVADINAAADAEGVDPAMVAAIIWNESHFNAGARSGAGAIGLGQLMPSTAAGLGVDPTDPGQNIRGTAKYLAQQLRTFGSLELAAAAYNAGPGAVRRHGGVPPYAETQAYVQKVTATYQSLRGAR